MCGKSLLFNTGSNANQLFGECPVSSARDAPDSKTTRLETLFFLEEHGEADDGAINE
jgi:hypothetical protein